MGLACVSEAVASREFAIFKESGCDAMAVASYERLITYYEQQRMQ
jgi:hypothetical protein